MNRKGIYIALIASVTKVVKVATLELDFSLLP